MGFPRPSTGAVTEDTGVVGGNLVASGDIDYYVGNDNGDWTPGTLTGTYGDLVIDSDGVWTYTADNSQPAIQALDTGDTLTEVFNVTSTGGNSTVTITINGLDEPPCFTRGTMIDTPHGPRPVEALRAGDEVLTVDMGVQRILWAGSKRVDLRDAAPDARLRPVRVTAGSIAPGVPARDLLVSPMHRILIDGPEAQLYFGQDEVLAAARHLVNGTTIVTDAVGEVEYFHLLFARHQILSAEGLISESFYPGGVGLSAFEEEAREEILTLFPELRTLTGGYGKTARDVLKRHEADLLRRVTLPQPLIRPLMDRKAA
ncbi:Hint domain-containing protein [Maritimibacter sp. UBA3975]|uniref:Hint domain-containing protein n=1 Tax=Maritimibacter sp. UBA3975 TaxID=1946833 RepID=UPI000C0B18E7|nr:Hint domain-containing protein [Maritimibacter sp. UBA3975]MAM60677.1 calcium-binding protein [Maritimibacter sp.]|tara:strand:+ start:1166 stop:2110 length:945 start_codon:yes stop_codon:yes gene_type:complete